MARLLAILVLALAAGCATLASSGLAVAPHAHPPGTARHDDHVLAAYRYTLFLMRLVEGAPDGLRFEAGTPLAESMATVVLALLVIVVPRLPRPARRPLALPVAPGLSVSQWRASPALGPPRRGVVRAARFA